MLKDNTIYSVLESIDPNCFVGVDALTVTGYGPLAVIGIRALIESCREKLEGADIKPFKFQGAEGLAIGPLRFASKRDCFGKSRWNIVMITGPLANDCLKWKVLDLKATRIDLRVDVTMTKPIRDLAEKLYKVNGERGKLIKSLVGETYYPDVNREATYYGRVYDKSPEYGNEWGSVWRWEIEVKRQAAEQIARQLLDASDPNGYIEKTVFGLFAEKWGSPTPKPGIKPTINYAGASVITPEQKLDWLRRNVARTVARLKDDGYTQEVMSILNL